MGLEIFDLSGKVAIVTGAGRGLGSYFANALAGVGADLVITSRKKEALTDVCNEIRGIGREVLPLELDVCEQKSIKDMVEVVMGRFGRIDILVNNAGCNVRKPALDMTWDDWNLVLDTNLRGPFFVACEAAKKMIPNHCGRIINIGSVTSVFGYAGVAPYCASRGGVKQMTMSLADEWGRYGITVNCLAPGWFKTEQNKVLYQDRGWVDYICDRIPLKRPGEPEDLKGTVIFLASDASRYITGQTILVDGGISTGATRATANSK